MSRFMGDPIHVQLRCARELCTRRGYPSFPLNNRPPGPACMPHTQHTCSSRNTATQQHTNGKIHGNLALLCLCPNQTWMIPYFFFACLEFIQTCVLRTMFEGYVPGAAILGISGLR
ncbi:unnamed protein product [Periconia digitata]|uniref:Uncharacterized protein n=1 Tax=Periconia digitata TaxID=1303443 RepID=A0A9W4U107_9PLEO|nr:unnamed protein product [Periconia digitata]